MPASYHIVHGSIWDHTFRPLSTEAKLVAVYVWTSPLRLSEGLFVQPPGYIALDTGLTIDQVRAGLAECEQVGLLRFDPDCELVLDPLALKVNPLRNGVNKKTGEVVPDKRIVPAVRKLRSLPSSPLKREFLALAAEHSPDLAAALSEDPAKGPSEGPAKGPSEVPPSEGPTEGPMEVPPKGPSKSKSKSASYENEHEQEREREVARSVQQSEVDRWDEFLPGDEFEHPDTSAGDVRFASSDALARRRGGL
jgi:hypothetical protein